ncbi:helix-turn-helix transcriptional regulator [Spelaeicoccus albus]|uniref:DNA-binding CsgD family transcriptional regulator n=1 Tax=Spelaeicoccus albus TaxID=1280376 RepID=A0A7Z0D1L7_9MICO|nr:LuxR C-terminal-related transcriptional regulator [Spelaeicoccus albus]NYI66477.1 DNA-binding CsgD family transcriptional regulator [Spelaeicoccus albus]
MSAESLERPSWPILARGPEFARALAILEAGARGLVLLGDAGTGKTALAEKIAAQYTAQHQATELPIMGAAGDSSLPWSTMARHVGDLTMDGDQVALDNAVRPIRQAGTGKTLLRVDDAGLLDEMSSQYVSWLVRAGHAIVLATTRRFQFLPQSMKLLVKDAHIEQIDIGPFTCDETGALLELALGGPVDDEFTRRLWRSSGGNALFIRELVRAGRNSGALVRTAGGWRWNGRMSASRRLQDLLRADLDRLPDAVRAVVELAALGEPMPRRQLLRLVDAADYDRALESGLVTVDVSRPVDVARVRPSHPLIGEVVREIVPAATRRDLYRLANEYRTRPSSSDTPTARLRTAMWALECGIDPGFDALLGAAVAAVQLHDIDKSVDLAGEALGAGDLTGAQRLRALAVRGFALGFVGNQERSRKDIDEGWRLLQDPDVVAAVRAAGWEDAACEIVKMRAGLAQYLDDDPDRAQAIIADGAWVLEWHCEDAADLLALSMRGWAGDWEYFMPAAGELVERHDAGMPAEVFALLAPYAFGLSARGKSDAALAVCRWAVDVARGNSDAEPWNVGQLRAAQHRASLYQGDIDAAQGWVAGGDDEDLSFVKYEQDLSSIGRAEIAMAQGRWSDAVTDLRHATERLENNDRGGLRAYAWIKRAYAEAVIGDTAARTTLKRARSEPLRGVRMTEDELRLALVCTAVVLGDDAVDEADKLIAWTQRRGLLSTELDALHVRYLLAGRRGGARSTLAEQVRAVAACVDGRRARLVREHVDALEAGDAVRIKRAVSDLGKSGTWVHAREPRPALTPREYEIAALAASGLTSRAIAERLHVSSRTVDSHLSRVFAKLNVSSRGDLGRYV